MTPDEFRNLGGIIRAAGNKVWDAGMQEQAKHLWRVGAELIAKAEIEELLAAQRAEAS